MYNLREELDNLNEKSSLKDIQKAKRTYFIRANELHKEKIARFPFIYDEILIALFLLTDSWTVYGSELLIRRLPPLNIFDFSNLTPVFLLVILTLIGLIVLKIISNKFDAKVKANIVKRRKETKEQNRKKNEEAHQKKLNNNT